jgi:hypothetical protein
MAKSEIAVGEPATSTTEKEDAFLRTVAAPRLEAVKNAEILKHAADTWWNLCLWEKQRADAIDAKATGVLGLASVASAIIGVTGTIGVTFWRVLAAVVFLLAAGVALWALRVKDHGGFADDLVFDALTSVPSTGEPPVTNDPSYIGYLQQTIMQRWLVYNRFKAVSRHRAGLVFVAQSFAVIAVVLVCWVLMVTRFPALA